MNKPPVYPTYVERTFSLLQVKNNSSLRYSRHPSGAVIIHLADSHPALQSEIASVDYDMGSTSKSSKDRSKQNVIGKGKKGGLRLQPDTKLCIINMKNGEKHTIRAGIQAILIEVNALLPDEPTLIQTSKRKRGFIAIVMPAAALQNISKRAQAGNVVDTPENIADQNCEEN